MKVPLDRYRRRVRWVGLGLLAFFYVVVPIPIRLVGGSTGFDVVFLLMFGGIGVLCWGGLCLLWWRILTVHAKWIAPQKVTWIVLALLPVVLVGGRCVYRSWPSVRAAWILCDGELAPLPPSAHAIKVNLWSMLVSGEGHLSFHATREDIDGFLAASPVFRDVDWAGDDPNEPVRFYPCHDEDAQGPEEIDYRVVRDMKRAPDWFLKELTESVTGYYVDPPGSISGMLFTDRRQDVVYVKLSYD